jgi:hypothetical protein
VIAGHCTNTFTPSHRLQMRTFTRHFLAREPRAHRSTEDMEAANTSSTTGGMWRGGVQGSCEPPERWGHAAQLTALHIRDIDDSEEKSMRGARHCSIHRGLNQPCGSP